VVEKSNLQRQVLFGTSSLGKNKAEAAKNRLEDLNDAISITTYPERLTHQNAIDLFKQYDIIVDGSDNFETRYLVNDACIITNKPLVFGAIYKFEGQVSVFNYKNGPTYRCLFPTPPEEGTVPNCSEIGVLGVLPGIIGTMQANEVLKIILGIGNTLSGKLLCYNALTVQQSILAISKNQDEFNTILNSKNHFHKKQSNFNCDIESLLVSIKDILSKENMQFIDVREAHEQPKVSNILITYIPLSELENSLDKIDTTKNHALFCQSGIRSKRAVNLLLELQIKNCVSIIEGATEIKQYIQEQQNTLTNER